MARASRVRPGRTLVVFFLVLAIAYGLVALAATWKPALGLDLQGGTRITLTALGDPDDESLEEARQIIDARVNGSGVTEAEVVVESGRYVVVEIPGDTRRDLIDVVQRQAQLRFRLVACSDQNPGPCAGAAPAALNRPAAMTDTPAPSESPAPSETATGSASPSPSESPSGPTPAPELGEGQEDMTVQEALAWQDAPNPQAIEAYNAFQCPTDGSPVNVVDDADRPLVTCEGPVKYLLSPAVVEGTALQDAFAGIPQQSSEYVVSLEIGGEGRTAFADVSRALYGTQKQFAIVLDGQVISAPTMNGVITNGRAQISGEFTQESAEDLATSLRFGALPIAFERESTVETIGPSLAGDQLRAGLWAGALGLILVLVFCLLYYRALGVVVLASFGVAAAAIYASVLLLSETAGFTLTLPGIAGLIIAVGVTADSFIIFFERIRDEMRDGKSMRVAVETGWVRARTTRVAANTVQLLSALVLYIFATGAVKGFGFALGLTTLIDLAVLFWFTKPMVSFLAQYRFFNSGNKLSGLSAETLGMDALPATSGVAGGRA